MLDLPKMLKDAQEFQRLQEGAVNSLFVEHARSTPLAAHVAALVQEVERLRSRLEDHSCS